MGFDWDIKLVFNGLLIEFNLEFNFVLVTLKIWLWIKNYNYHTIFRGCISIYRLF